MKKQIDSLKKNISDNRTYYAFCAGSIVTSLTFLALNKNVQVLKVKNEHVELLKKGGAVVFDLKGQTLHLTNLEALREALKTVD